MLKMRGEAVDGGAIIVLGLSHGNLDNLRAGKPIIVKGEDVGQPGLKIMIFSGETERSMARDFMEFVGPETKLHIDPRLRD